MAHPLYPAMIARLTDYERTIARALETYKPDWWQSRIHPQTMIDYLDAPDDARRVSAMTTMARDAINWAMMAFNAIASTETRAKE